MPSRIFIQGYPEEACPNPNKYEARVSLWAANPGITIHHNLNQLWASPRLPGPAYQSLLLLATSVWAADKLLPRTTAPDAWTRELSLEIPVSRSWMEPVTKLAPFLDFLTGDHWQLILRPGSPDLGFGAEWKLPWTPDLVCLFSGGVDSLVGAVDFLEAGYRLLLISHYDFGQLAGYQKNLATLLIQHYGPDRVLALGLRVQLEAPELSLRSRSLLFIALGLTAAGAFDQKMPLLIPENGFISLNLPLTLNRLGSYSTRTTHPYFIHNLNKICRQAHIHHSLINPYQGQTKGEMVARCRGSELLGALLPHTLSCSHPVVSRWHRQPQGNCGYCFPCLLRRAALHRVGQDRGQDYLYDVLADEELVANRVRGADLRSLLFALQNWEGSGRQAKLLLHRTGPLEGDLGAKYRVLEAGMTEIKKWLQDQAHPHLKRYVGW
ncbi:MAG: Qat anti-phage system QueC-like protein QatC [Desulfobacteraceae bacterium]